MTTREHYQRRPQDESSETYQEIKDLILQADKKDQAPMLVMLKLCDNLERNTIVTEETAVAVKRLDESFAVHEGKEKVMLGQAKASWFIVSGIMVIFLGIAGAWVKAYTDDYKSLYNVVMEIRHDVDKIHERHKLKDAHAARGEQK